MWPFTSRRIFGNRWWAIAFVVFVCWQAVEMIDGMNPPKNDADAAADAARVQAMENTLNAM